MRAEILRPPPGVARVSLGEVRRHPVELGVCVVVLGVVLVGVATTRRAGTSAVESVLTRTSLADPAPILTGPAATRFCVLLLSQAQRTLDRARSIRAVLHTRDGVDGALAELAAVEVKVRRQPMSVYMRWQSPHRGREAVWQESAEGPTFVARDGGDGTGALLSLDLATQPPRESLPRPVNRIALWALNEHVLAYVKELGDSTDCQLIDGVEIDGRACWLFRLIARPSGTTRKHEVARVYIDRSLELPVAAELHGAIGRERGEPTLVDSWAVTGLQLNPELGDEDFRLSDAAEAAQGTVARP